MIVPEYVPGDWHAVVAGGVIALLDPSTPADVVRAVWDAVPARGGLADQLEVLLQGGIARLRPFALVDLTGGRVHAALRGAVEVEVSGADGVRVLSVGDVTTWSERSADDADEVTVRVVGATGVADVTMPVVSGVVRASSVRVPLASGRRSAHVADLGTTGSAAEPAAAPDVPVPDATADVPVPVLDAPVLVRSVPVMDVVGPDVPEPEAAEPDAEPVAAPWAPAGQRVNPFTLVPSAPETDPELDALSASRVVAEAEAVLEADARRAHDDVGVPDDVGMPDDRGARDDTGAPGFVGASDEADVPDDHDGLTILSSDLQTIRDQLPSWAGDAVPGPFRVAAKEVAPPAKLVLSTGQVVVLDQTVLLGRAPQVSRVTNRELPRLVTLPSPQQDISRTHAEVRADGDDVLVTDLRSTNGILVSRPGEPARRLHPGEPSVITRGEIVDLGDGVTFTVESSA